MPRSRVSDDYVTRRGWGRVKYTMKNSSILVAFFSSNIFEIKIKIWQLKLDKHFLNETTSSQDE